MAVLGPTKAARPSTMRAFAAILATFDLAALQEVGSNDSSASDATCELVLTALVRGISDASGGAPFKYIREGQYAFVYRSDRLEAEPLGTVSSAASFAYPPFAARFRTIGRALDFVAITAHTRPSLAVSEVPALAIAMDEAAMAHAEPDVICLGDFNADGAYYDEGEESGLSGFPTKRFTSVIPDDADTTVATGSLAYDRIILSSYMNDDWTGAWGVVKPKELVDVSACEGTASTTGTERALSDHYPVWLELRTSVDRD